MSDAQIDEFKTTNNHLSERIAELENQLWELKIERAKNTARISALEMGYRLRQENS